MKKLILLLITTLSFVCCTKNKVTYSIDAKVAVVYQNGDKDTLLVHRVFVYDNEDYDKPNILLTTTYGESCLISYGQFESYKEACGVRKIEILSKLIQKETKYEKSVTASFL